MVERNHISLWNSPLQLFKSPRNQTWQPEPGTKRKTRCKNQTWEPDFDWSRPFRMMMVMVGEEEEEEKVEEEDNNGDDGGGGGGGGG